MMVKLTLSPGSYLSAVDRSSHLGTFYQNAGNLDDLSVDKQAHLGKHALAD